MTDMGIGSDADDFIRDNRYVVLGTEGLMYAGDDPGDAMGAFALATLVGMDRSSGDDVRVYLLGPVATAEVGIGKHVIRATQTDFENAFATIIGMTPDEFAELGPQGGKVQ